MARSKATPSADISNLLDTLKPASPAPPPPLAGQQGRPEEPETSPADEPSTVEITNLPSDDRVLPGFAMADSPEELEDNAAAMSSTAPLAASQQGRDAMANAPPPSPVAALDIPDNDIDMPSSRPATLSGRYESRIRILDAFQYPGNLATAPHWIDRNWVGYHPDYDPVRNIEPGPALRVPTRGGDEMAWCRPGDYVVRQEVVLAHGIRPDVVIEVWPRESFEKNFIPGWWRRLSRRAG